MTDFVTLSPDQLPEIAEIPEDLRVIVAAPGGNLQRVAHSRLLSKLIATSLAKTTRAVLYADLAHDADSVALVFSDPTALLNGWYRKTGISGAGAWVQFETLALATRAAMDELIDQAELAANSAAAAGNYFVSQAAGEAGTVAGAFFSHPDGAGGLVYRERTGGGSTIIAYAATKAQIDARLAVFATRTDLADMAIPANGESSLLTEAGREGVFKYSTANLSAFVTADTAQGVYVAPASDTTGASGAWVRDPNQPLTLEMFGGVADWNGATGTDNYAAIMAAIAYRPRSDRSFAAKIHLSGSYYTAQTINAHQTCHFVGRGGGGNTSAIIGLTNTRIITPVNTTTWVNHATNTSDSGGSQAVGDTGANGSIYEYISFEQATQGATATAHAFWMRGYCILRFCTFRNIAGHGLFINPTAGSGGATEGNCNGWVVDNCFAHTVLGNAMHIIGNDSNAGISTNFVTAGNTIGGCGIYDGSGLGNAHIAPQITGYGNTGVTQGGRRYVLITLNNINDSATTTPGTNNSVWYDIGAGGVSAIFPAYVGGTTYKFTCPILGVGASSRTTIVGGYEEVGGAGYCHLGQAGVAIGGGFLWTTTTRKFDANPEINSSLFMNGDGRTLEVTNNLGWGHRFSVTSGASNTYHDTVNNISGQYGARENRAIYHLFQAGIATAVAEVARITDAGLNLVAIPLKYSGTQVIGAQGAAVADATDAASAITQLNALLARCRAHGLIAT